jgi:hypothetical protein
VLTPSSIRKRHAVQFHLHKVGEMQRERQLVNGMLKGKPPF